MTTPAVFDMDIESTKATPAAMIISHPSSLPTLDFRYLQGANLELAKGMLRLLGKALGMKQSTIFVDSIIADLYEECLSRVDNQLNLTGKSQVQWLHQWIGSLVLAREVRASVFSLSFAW